MVPSLRTVEPHSFDDRMPQKREGAKRSVTNLRVRELGFSRKGGVIEIKTDLGTTNSKPLGTAKLPESAPCDRIKNSAQPQKAAGNPAKIKGQFTINPREPKGPLANGEGTLTRVRRAIILPLPRRLRRLRKFPSWRFRSARADQWASLIFPSRPLPRPDLAAKG